MTEEDGTDDGEGRRKEKRKRNRRNVSGGIYVDLAKTVYCGV